MFKAVGQEQFGNSNSGRTGTIYDNLGRFRIFSGYFHSINDSGKNYDSSSVLVIMKYRDIKHFFQTFLDFETTRSGDVFQIDTAESGSYIFNSFDDLFSILCVKTDRYSVDTTEFFKKNSLSFHNGHCRKSTDITKTEYGTSVRNNSYSIGFHSISIGSLGIFCDYLTRFCNTRGIGNCKIFT